MQFREEKLSHFNLKTEITQILELLNIAVCSEHELCHVMGLISV
jgi:hypothetical protein